VLVGNGASNNVIGGLTSTPGTGPGNVISGNTLEGVLLTDSGTTGNTILGNLIGLDWSGTNDVANKQDGVAVQNGASGNTIGGTTDDAPNIISGNTKTGVWISDAGTTSNLLLGDWIGTDITGTARVPNRNFGVKILNGASGNTVGAGNVISGNSNNGVYIV